MSSTPLSSSHTVTTRGLQRLLNPLEVGTFLRDHLGVRMVHARGSEDRWADLFSWSQLDAALNSGLISYPRARLMKQGPEVAPDLYTYERGTRRWLDSHRCQALMADGATLVVMDIEGLSPALSTFVRDLERDTGARFRVDVVATTASIPGLNMHWDNAECFNVQLDGQKEWRVIQPPRPYPLTATQFFPDRVDITRSASPDVPPTWTGTIVSGDLIYLPRGWWHAVTPRISPSLHLSLAADIPTLTDFLRWLAGESAHLESARRPIPVWLDPNLRNELLAEALAELRSQLTTESLHTYLRQLTDFAPTRPVFRLPHGATPSGVALGGATLVCVQSLRRLDPTIADGTAQLSWRDQAFRFPETAMPALRMLDERRMVPFEDLAACSDPMLAQVVVFTLANVGLLALTHASEDSR